MAVYFLADIHLSDQRSDITAAFEQTVNALSRLNPEGVFILGDLFDYYLGDDLMSDFQRRIAIVLHTLSQRTPLFYQHGNRDFLIKRQFAQLSGMTLLPERYRFELNAHRILIEHGDLLCTDDTGYQSLRKVLRHPFTYQLYRLIPAPFKHRLARYLRLQSQRAGASKPSVITDTNPQAISAVMHTFAADILIHGHTHRPQIQSTSTGSCYVLGDWHPHGKILIYNNEKFDLFDSKELT